MLILSRRPGDAVLLDGGIRVVVVGVEGGTVRLGIEAPRGVGIVREEVALRIAEENRRAGALPRDRDWMETLRAPGPGDEAPRRPLPSTEAEAAGPAAAPPSTPPEG